MAYQEKDFQSDFTYWLRQEREQGRHKQSAAYELKIAKASSLPFSKFQPQQLPKLSEAKHGCVYKKLSDLDPSLKPFDAFQICHAEAYVVILFYKPRKEKQMVWIDIDKFLEHIKAASRKSITEEEARSIGTVYTL